VVADGVEVSLERAGAFGRWFGAEQLMKIMSCVRKIGANSDRSFTVEKPPIRSDDRRERRDCGHRVVERIFLAAEAEKSRCHPQRVDHRRFRGCSLAKNFERHPRQRTPRC
jgi:hypothetical protein